MLAFQWQKANSPLRAVLRSGAERVGVLDRARGFPQQLRDERVGSDRCRQELREPSREVGVAGDPIADLVRRPWRRSPDGRPSPWWARGSKCAMTSSGKRPARCDPARRASADTSAS